ncbi:helix-turn-helix domain-containing protein [Acrocarpospora catenulata]|uniref:helix-turn-helix domain-containing protein n=1 Tax=Acrocarpospora catenulata TaxID=2836182 RepID=UPI002023B286|nr:helix-turn-helix transcriptional regulator [Acrocarpospora catenulata]
MLVGAQLRRLREAAGMSREKAGDAIRGSHSKISRMELGRHSFKLRDVADLLDLYGATRDERDSLLCLAEQSNASAWWHAYRDVIPDWFDQYLGLEQAASVIRSSEVQFIPGLLQTEQYARAVIRLGHLDAPNAEIERRVALRLRRQEILRKQSPAVLWTVIDEAALRRQIGDREIMRAQLAHLRELSHLRNVTIQVMPFSSGHPVGGGPVTILRFAETRVPDVAYLEQLAQASYLSKPNDLDTYWHLMNQLCVLAATPDESRDLIRQIIAET